MSGPYKILRTFLLTETNEDLNRITSTCNMYVNPDTSIDQKETFAMLLYSKFICELYNVKNSIVVVNRIIPQTEVNREEEISYCITYMHELDKPPGLVGVVSASIAENHQVIVAIPTQNMIRLFRIFMSGYAHAVHDLITKVRSIQRNVGIILNILDDVEDIVREKKAHEIILTWR